MRIALLSDLFYPYQLGGAERQFFEIAVRLAKKHDVHVFTMNLDGQPKEEVIKNIHVHRIGIKHPLNRRSLLSLLTYFLLFPFLNKEFKKFDIVHANQNAGIFSFLIRKPFVITIHDLYLEDWKKYYNFPFYYLGELLELLMLKGKYERIITVSNNSKSKIQKFGLDTPIAIIPNGIDLRFINNVKTKKKNHIVYIGRLVNYKHVDLLIKAMKKVQKRFPDINLHIIGYGEQKNHLEKLAKDLKVKVKFFGYVNERKKIEELKSARIFVNMSTIEGFGISPLEAMACGTPVIARKLECYKEFCTRDNSLLIEHENLSDTIIKLLENKNMEKTLIKNGLKTAKKFEWNIIVKKIENVYKDILTQTSP
ncbi:MAG: glycosyltransferase family 4 protein [Candidatus Aenigmarchaeota archaeon]|nr:glycosyltransferase family 4 protein [Candidatus Aenigmarchaeota archaeon]